jgi:hypothetical protein
MTDCRLASAVTTLVGGPAMRAPPDFSLWQAVKITSRANTGTTGPKKGFVNFICDREGC